MHMRDVNTAAYMYCCGGWKQEGFYVQIDLDAEALLLSSFNTNLKHLN